MKPVHRRILYGMRSLSLNPGARPKKSAKIVGDVMGSYHPHGDQAIYDAMVRLAQDFASRYPLVDGQGNFGNIDGDNPAAMRYTEARLTDVARLLLDGIDEDAVEFRPTYDGAAKSRSFCRRLPQSAGQWLAGHCGRHGDLDPAAQRRRAVRRRAASDRKAGCEIEVAVEMGQGSGFPDRRHRRRFQGEHRGSLCHRARLVPRPRQVEAGRGRARHLGDRRSPKFPSWCRNPGWSRRSPNFSNEKKLPLVGDVRDESAEDVRLVIEPKSRAVDPELLMESLFRLTELESRIPLNINVLMKGRIPKVVGLAECLREWLDHLRDVLVRRSNYRMGEIEHRLEVLGGYLIAYLNLDKVIKIIRTEDEPKPVLIKAFKLTEVQAEAILNMRLRNLRKLEEMEIRGEDKDLRAELKGIKGLLGSETEQWAKIGEQVRKVRDMFGPKTPLGKRRTQFADAPEHDLAAIEEAFVEREPVTVVISEKGWVRTLKGHVADLSGLTFKTDDKLDHAFFAETTSKLLLFGTNGKFYSLDVAKLPGGRGHGEPIRMFIDLDQDAAIVSTFVNKGGRKFLIASGEGQGFIVNEDDCVGNTRKGKQVLNVEMPNEARAITTVAGDTVAVIGTNHKMVIFPIDQVPEMARGRGVRLQKYTSADAVGRHRVRFQGGADLEGFRRPRAEHDASRNYPTGAATAPMPAASRMACRSRTSSSAAWSRGWAGSLK